METWLIAAIIIVFVFILVGIGILCFVKRDSIKKVFNKTEGGWTNDEVYYEIKRVLNKSCRDCKHVIVEVKNNVYNKNFKDNYDIIIVEDGAKNCYEKIEELKQNRNSNYSYYFCIKRYDGWAIEKLSF